MTVSGSKTWVSPPPAPKAGGSLKDQKYYQVNLTSKQLFAIVRLPPGTVGTSSTSLQWGDATGWWMWIMYKMLNFKPGSTAGDRVRRAGLTYLLRTLGIVRVWTLNALLRSPSASLTSEVKLAHWATPQLPHKKFEHAANWCPFLFCDPNVLACVFL